MRGRVIERDSGGLLRLEEAAVLTSLAGADDVARGFELLYPGGHGIRAVPHERGEALYGEHPLGIVLNGANLAVDPLGLRREAVV